MMPGFELMTFGTWVSSHNHYTRGPAPFSKCLLLFFNVPNTTSFSILYKQFYWIKTVEFEFGLKESKVNMLTIEPPPQPKCFFKKWANAFLFIFVLFKHKFYRTNCSRLQDSNLDWQSRRWARWPLDHHHGHTAQMFFCLYKRLDVWKSYTCDQVTLLSSAFEDFFLLNASLSFFVG